MTINQAINKLIEAEFACKAPDGRRVIRQERMRLMVAVQTRQFATRDDIQRALDVAKMWDGYR